MLDGTFKRFARRAPTSAAPAASSSAPNPTAASRTSPSPTASSTAAAAWRSRRVDGALLEDVTITNITMRDISNAPIFLRLGSAHARPRRARRSGTLRRVIISNIVCSNASGADLHRSSAAFPAIDIEDVKLSNIYIQHRGGGTAEDAALQLAEEEKEYPDPGMFGKTSLACLFIRHVRGLAMNDVKIATQKDDARPAFVLDQIESADFFHINGAKHGDIPVFRLSNVEDFSIASSKSVSDTTLPKVDTKDI